MSNRDGKNAKQRKKSSQFNIGKVCPICNKGKLERAIKGNKDKDNWKSFCPHCNFTNF